MATIIHPQYTLKKNFRLSYSLLKRCELYLKAPKYAEHRQDDQVRNLTALITCATNRMLTHASVPMAIAEIQKQLSRFTKKKKSYSPRRVLSTKKGRR